MATPKVDWHVEITTQELNMYPGTKWIGVADVWEHFEHRMIIRPRPQEFRETHLVDTPEEARKLMEAKVEAWLAQKRKERDETDEKKMR